MPQKTKTPLIAVGILVVRSGKVLLARRKGPIAGGQYGNPGGKLAHGEGLKACARRELLEECGAALKIKKLRFLSVFESMGYLPHHFIFIYFIADWKSGEALIQEPDKHGPWEWHGLKKLPLPLSPSARVAIGAYQNGFSYKDA